MHFAALGAAAILPVLANAGVPHMRPGHNGRAFSSSSVTPTSSILTTASSTSTAVIPTDAATSSKPVIPTGASASSSLVAASSSLVASPSNTGLPIFGLGVQIPGLTGPADLANWTTVECTSAVTDATLDPRNRWAAAGATGAFNDMMAAWAAEGAAAKLSFPEFASNFFVGPSNWACRDIGNTPCSTVVTCNQVNHPAGYLILNSFSSLHQLHQGYYQALQDAVNSMQNYVGQFSSIFAPQEKDGSATLKVLLDVLVMMTAVASSYAWGIAFEANLVMGINNGFSKDVTNAAINSFAIAAAKDTMKSSTDALGTQNSVSAALGGFFDEWEKMESKYVDLLFSGADDTDANGALQGLVGSGGMLMLPSPLSLAGLSADAQKIMYGQLIPAAWGTSPQDLHPVIIRKEGGCSQDFPQEFDTNNWMDKSTYIGGYVCYENDAFFVVNAKHITRTSGPNGIYTENAFQGLPGGTHSTLDGKSWGGVILEDIVQSSWQAYQNNGNQNGYKMGDVSSIIDGKGTQGEVVFQNGIRTPGFFNLPICNDIGSAWATAANSLPNGKYWPCDGPAGYNTKGTNVHVNYGCVTINDETKCASGSVNIPDQGTDTTTASIYAQFNGNDKTDYQVVPGCKLAASWPRAYGDVFFGQDNCLYDSNGQQINGQCCTEATTDQVKNPYYNN